MKDYWVILFGAFVTAVLTGQAIAQENWWVAALAGLVSIVLGVAGATLARMK